jgi:hypothetical protein
MNPTAPMPFLLLSLNFAIEDYKVGGWVGVGSNRTYGICIKLCIITHEIIDELDH